MAIRIITAPAEEPVTIADVKTHLRVTATDQDAYIEGLIAAARGHAEAELQRALIAQTLEFVTDRFPCGSLDIPINPVQSLVSIKYIDTAGVEQTLAGANYKIDITSLVARIVPAYGLTWPATRGEINAVTVRFVAGYGAAAAVPNSIRQAILLIVGELYERREAAIVGSTLFEVPMSAKALLSPHRNHVFI